MPPTPEDIVRSLPCWRGAPKITPLYGGLSNTIFRVDDDAGAFVARLGQDFPFHHVSRRREAAASQAAAAAGLSPQVRFVGEGVMVCDYIEGRTLDEVDQRDRLEAIVDLIRRCHSQMRERIRGSAAFFWIFHVIRDYADTLRAGGHAITPELDEFVAIAAVLEAEQIPLPIVFGHHDLLSRNFLDDGKRLWLIDWEYAGFGTPMFDLANLADNGAYDGASEDRLLTLYFERAPDADMRRAFDAMKLASALREMLWAMVSQLRLSAPGVDYSAYALACQAKFTQSLQRYKERRGPIA